MSDGPRPRAVVFAYACEPDRGSEPGAAWGVVRALADVADCTVLVGPAHAEALARWQASHGDDRRCEFVIVPDGGAESDFRTRGRVQWFASYLRWVPAAARAAVDRHRAAPFDVACHASYATYWLPSPAAALDVPLVWGPVGGAVTTDVRLWPLLGARGVVDELLDLAAVRAMAARPATRATWRGATVPVVQNDETRRSLSSAMRERARVLNHALFTDVAAPTPSHASRRDALFVGALETRKGGALAVRAMAHVPHDVRLTIAGDGPTCRDLEGLAASLGVADRIAFLGAVPRARVFELLDGAAAAVFVGLREEGGLALAEAMLRGTPVVVLAHGGARTIAAAAVDPSRVALVSPGSVDETARRIAAGIARFTAAPPAASTPNLDQAAARRALHEAVHAAIAARW